MYIENTNRQVQELALLLDKLDREQVAEWTQQEADWARRRRWARTPVQKIEEETSIENEYGLLKNAHQLNRKQITDRLAEARNSRDFDMREKADLQDKTDQQMLSAAFIDAKIAELNQDFEHLIAGWNARPKPKRLAELKQILSDSVK